MLKIKMNTSEVSEKLRASIKRMGIEKKRLQTKIWNNTEYGAFVERGWGGPVSKLSTPGGKDSFDVNFSPRFMMRSSLRPTHEFFLSQISGVLKDPKQNLINDLSQLLESTTAFGLGEVISRTPIQFWLNKDHLMDDWHHSQVQEVSR